MTSLESPTTNPSLSPELAQDAAQGSAVAQGAMAEHALLLGESGACRLVEALTGAELWARMAASHGAYEHIRQLVVILILRATFERNEGQAELSVALEAEALALLDAVANDGDEIAETTLAIAADTFSPEAFALLRSREGASA